MNEFNVDELGLLETPSYTRSIKLLDAIQKNSDYEFCGAKLLKIGDDLHLEILIVTLICDGVPDVNPYGIEYRERIGIVVAPENSAIPEVWTLRDDFPCLPHMNDRPSWMPNNICLYSENEIVINRTWTAEKFLKRIYWWIEQSAKGELHTVDQPLEQLFFNSKYELILPKECGENLENINGDIYITSGPVRADSAVTFFINFGKNKNPENISAHIIYLEFPPAVHGTISPNPHSLSELYEAVSTIEVSAKQILKDHIQMLVPATGRVKKAEECRTIIIVKLPISREIGSVVEKVQLKAFLAVESPIDIGEKSGFLFLSPDDGKLYNDINILDQGKISTPDIELFPVEVLKMNSREDFLKQSGITSSGGNYVLVGLGSLGSTLFNLWNRAGWGEWTLIDKDHLKPHNLTRHMAIKGLVGWNKASACAVLADNSTDSAEGLKAFEADAMSGDKDVIESLSHTDLVIDVSTTLDYPRAVSFIDEYSRHCSLFITPSGNDSVLLLEDKDRIFRLRTLEAQYYRTILNSDWGEKHLSGHLGKFVSGANCRDISLKLPFSAVMCHAAILCEQVMALSEENEPRILIWRRNKVTGSVQFINCLVSKEVNFKIGGYQIFFDKGLEEKLNVMRDKNLPAETGGILLGYHDLNLNSIFIVDALPAPSDSISTQTEFQRGTFGTMGDVDKAREKTANVVDYIGEWHSHPRNATINPSGKDVIQLCNLSKLLSEDGLPAIQLIAGEEGINIIVGELLTDV